MNTGTLRAIQVPLKDKYRTEPATAMVTLKAQAQLGAGITHVKLPLVRHWSKPAYIPPPAVMASQPVPAICCSKPWPHARA